METKPFYITTPIYYVNGEPHIGHVYTTLLADTLSRFRRLEGEKVFFMTGCDEHGQKVQQTAEARGVACQDWCDQLAVVFKNCFKYFNFNYDRFIRTTDEDHVKVATELWRTLVEKDLIYKANYKGWYCVADEAFVTDTNVTDGVDKDGNPCKITTDSRMPCIQVEEVNYMFRLSRFAEPLLRFYEEHPNAIQPEFRQREIVQFIRTKGLIDISVSRPKSKIYWGIPIPGDDEQVMYVWIDALANYLTGARTLGGDFWPADVHFLGKDIIRFHCIYWPAFLMGAGLELPRKWHVHGWWMVSNRKIGKSLGNAFDPKMIAERYSLDALKYFMLKEAGPESDPSISEESIAMTLNSDLANSLGNALLRCWSDSINYERCLPDITYNKEQISSLAERVTAANNDKILLIEDQLIALINATDGKCKEVVDFMHDINTSGAINSIMQIVTLLNNYIQTTQPWRLVKVEKDMEVTEDIREIASEVRKTILFVCLECLRVVGTLLLPFMPEKMAEMLDQLNVPEDLRKINQEVLKIGAAKAGTKLGEKKDVLFKKFDYAKMVQDQIKAEEAQRAAEKKKLKEAEKLRKASQKAKLAQTTQEVEAVADVKQDN